MYFKIQCLAKNNRKQQQNKGKLNVFWAFEVRMKNLVIYFCLYVNNFLAKMSQLLRINILICLDASQRSPKSGSGYRFS